ncbi:hypothetical protein [Luteimonas sp. R10]|uniref:hypothetical protein n=1 Tax=Luteimonas sp. R10 TaxID=3108176 RepID=UPI00308D4A6F|nr:hypothetical protein U3649_07530 [Luteimonas sp. R10]
MTADTDDGTRFDRAARACHQEALRQVSPRTLARLRPRAPAPGWRAQPLRWSLATACTIAFVYAFAAGMGLLPSGGDAVTDEMPMATVDAVTVEPRLDPYEDALVAFEEDPDLFLWLASAEAQPLAME